MDKPNSNKKMDLKKIKKNTFNSLNEVEFFLRDFKRFSNYIKLYKMFRPKRNALRYTEISIKSLDVYQTILIFSSKKDKSKIIITKSIKFT